MSRNILSAALAGSLTLGLAAAAHAEIDYKKYDGTTLNLVYHSATFLPGLEKLLPEFEELTGIKVNIDTLSEASAMQKVQLELATGSTAYDIIGVQSGVMPLYAENNWVVPVANFIGDDTLSDPIQLAIDDFIPSTLNAMAVGGTQQCLPFFAATVMLYYQIDKLKAAGFDSPPTTFEELLEVAAKVHTDDLPAIALRGSPASAAGNIWAFNLFFYGHGAKYFADFPNDYTPQVNSPEAIKALETFIELKQNYAADGAVNFVFDDVVTSMQQGTVSMVIDGAPLAGRILDKEQSKVSGNLGFAVVPGGVAGPKPSFAAHGMCVAGGSRSPEAAYMFLEWATSAETMAKVSQNSNYLATPRNAVWENPDFVSKYNFDFGGGEFLKVYQASLNAAPADYYPPFPGWGLVGERIGQAVQEAEIGQKTPTEALNDANEDITRILKEEGFLN